MNRAGRALVVIAQQNGEATRARVEVDRRDGATKVTDYGDLRIFTREIDKPENPALIDKKGSPLICPGGVRRVDIHHHCLAIHQSIDNGPPIAVAVVTPEKQQSASFATENWLRRSGIHAAVIQLQPGGSITGQQVGSAVPYERLILYGEQPLVVTGFREST
ncbi:hypothetical protein GCM10020219_071790 [Nonomuraea dietziae]